MIFCMRIVWLRFTTRMQWKCRNKFVSSWFAFNLTMNNVLVALTARKFKMDIAPLIVGDTEVCEALRTSDARDFGLGLRWTSWISW